MLSGNVYHRIENINYSEISLHQHYPVKKHFYAIRCRLAKIFTFAFLPKGAMYFIHPEILWGLLALLIPIIIHLFNFRRYRKLPFSNIEFLKNITRQTRKQNKLKHLIVLLLRMGAVALVVLAFANPRLNSKNKNINSTVKALYIDNSFSMIGEGENGMLFENARQLTVELIKSSGRDQRYMLQTNDYTSGKQLLNRDEVLKEIDHLKVTPSVRMLSSVNNRQRKLLKKFKGIESFWFSDFQQNSADFSHFTVDSADNYFFFPLEHAQNKNIYIDSCYFSKPLVLPGKQAEMNVVLVNTSSASYEKVLLTLVIDGVQRAVAGVDLPAFKRVEVPLTFTTLNSGWQAGKLTIDDYPITFDDDLFFSFRVNSRINVLDIFSGKDNPYFAAFFSADSIFSYHAKSYLQLDPTTFSEYSLIILDALPEVTSGLTDALLKFTLQGGNLLFVPSEKDNLEADNRFLKQGGVGSFLAPDTTVTRVKGIKTADDVFRAGLSKVPENADLPKVSFHYKMHHGIASATESLISLLNGDDFLTRKKSGGGALYVLTAPVNKKTTNFAFNPLFASMLYGIAITTNKKSNLFYYIGNDEQVIAPVPTSFVGDNIITLKQQDGNYSFIPGQLQQAAKTLLQLHNGITKAGIYQADINDSTLCLLAFNYNRNESDGRFLNRQKLDSVLKNSSLKHYAVLDGIINNVREVINQQQKGAQFWKLFIIFAALLLLAEVMILRWWK